MNPLVELNSKKMARKDVTEVEVGDHLKVWTIISEGDKERLQPFEGDVIRIHRNGISTTFTLRKISYGVGVERIVPLYSPYLARVEVLRKGRIRRARLYYLRSLAGKNAKIQEKRFN